MNARVQAPGLTGTPGLIVMPAQNATPKNITVFAGLASPQQILSAIQKAQNCTRPIRPGLSNPAKGGYPLTFVGRQFVTVIRHYFLCVCYCRRSVRTRPDASGRVWVSVWSPCHRYRRPHRARNGCSLRQGDIVVVLTNWSASMSIIKSCGRRKAI